ncbi:hypothetical protein WOLCODRAFT_19307 [Wolfiporia cocos MD-104 SS10]|uniref:Uncharacterized protein n=1 Tax=Wolfiporia cocos (strain MD-104) TaxID=742152 RepID=A0A2H3JSS7_WOLCO|nr:hypothetical protein WOLCODRAFT_19307 [Wolfiporia cocos MD-104 SS10]
MKSSPDRKSRCEQIAIMRSPQESRLLVENTLATASGCIKRTAVLRAEKLQLTSMLFDGGALDSQVTDSQYIRNLTGEANGYSAPLAPPTNGSRIECTESQLDDVECEQTLVASWSQSTEAAGASDAPSKKSAKTSLSIDSPLSVPEHQLEPPSIIHGRLGTLLEFEVNMVRAMRQACEIEIQKLQVLLDEAHSFQDILQSEHNALMAWNEDLVCELEMRGIPVPQPPQSQYAV